MATAVINGEKRELPEGLSIIAFLQSREVSPLTVVIEFNGKIISRDEWSETVINSGDNIEIIRMMGGG